MGDLASKIGRITRAEHNHNKLVLTTSRNKDIMKGLKGGHNKAVITTGSQNMAVITTF